MAVRNLIVTGATRGIGRATLELLIHDGCKIAAVARNAMQLEELARQYPDHVAALPTQLASASETSALVTRAVAALGHIDGLISCAGVARHRPSKAVTVADFDEQLALNLRAPLFLARDVAEHVLGRNRPGSIVLVASSLALSSAPETLVYTAAKGGIVSATRALAVEYARHKIRVNCVCPGVVNTDMVLKPKLHQNDTIPQSTLDLGEAANEKMVADLRSMHPLGRLGEASDIARTIRHLLHSNWMTGSIVTIDGGLTAGRAI